MYDPYAVLGVSRDAADEEIKKAYRVLSRKYHPDANVNNPHKEQAEEKFKEIQQAYQQIMQEKEHKAAGNYGSYGQEAAPGILAIFSEVLEQERLDVPRNRMQRAPINGQRQIISAVVIFRRPCMCWEISVTKMHTGII